jgi:hypothetical protein
MKPFFARSLLLVCLWLAASAGSSLSAKDHKDKEKEKSGGKEQLADATVLIIRHADKPESGDGLSPAGVTRANEYVSYFENYLVDGAPIKPTALFAAADSKESHRPFLTLEPLSRAIGLPIDAQYKDKDYAKLADALQSANHGKYILICWHHGEIPSLLRALGADPDQLIPGGKWPGDQYGWVMQLRYDKDAHLKDSTRIVEPF